MNGTIQTAELTDEFTDEPTDGDELYTLIQGVLDAHDQLSELSLFQIENGFRERPDLRRLAPTVTSFAEELARRLQVLATVASWGPPDV